MNRRNFLKTGFVGIAGLTLSKSLLFSNNINQHFSIDVITDLPDKAVTLISVIVNKFFQVPVNFSESQMYGSFNGDIVYIKNNQLINFYKNSDKFSKELFSVTKNLNLPDKLSNPYLLTFKSSVNDEKPKFADIFVENKLIDRIDLNYRKANKTILSNKGELILGIDNGNVWAVESSCKHKNCVHKGHIHKSGENIVCIPNKIRISLDGNNNGIDSISY